MGLPCQENAHTCQVHCKTRVLFSIHAASKVNESLSRQGVRKLSPDTSDNMEIVAAVAAAAASAAAVAVAAAAPTAALGQI